MMRSRFTISGRRAAGLVSLPAVLIAGAALWAALPTSISPVSLTEPLSAYPCTAGGCTYSASSYTTARYNGATSGALTGSSLAVGDLNNDGYDDLAVGAPQDSTGKGRVYVVYGSASQPATTVNLSSAVVITGIGSSDNLGAALDIADLNGDGKEDLAIGAPGAGTPATGLVYVIPGGSNWTSQAITGFSGLVTVSGATNGDKLGYSIAADDITTDLKADLLIGAPGASKAYILAGPITSVAASSGHTLQGGTGENLGFAVAAAGDLNKDGSRDFLLGAPLANPSGSGTYGGAAYLINGRSNFTPGVTTNLGNIVYQVRKINGDLTETGKTQGRLGYSLAGIGDVNLDGYPDIALGAPYAPRSNNSYFESGRVYVLFGSGDVVNYSVAGLSSLSGSYFYGELNGDHLGTSISAAGDVDNNNFADFLIGAEKNRSDISTTDTNGAAYLLSGRTTSDWPSSTPQLVVGANTMKFFGKNKDDLAGTVVYGFDGLDLDGDSYDDFFISAPAFDVTASGNEGRVYYISFGDFLDRDTDGQSRAAGDCSDLKNDNNAKSVYYDSTGNTEKCDGLDNDCDGKIDDADSKVTGTSTFYTDNDSDTYGTLQAVYACTQPAKTATRTGDCNDADAAVNPTAQEICDSKDNDCDGSTDGADSSLSGTAYYTDADNDKYGSSASTAVQGCPSAPPSGKVANNTDCLDSDNAVYPGAAEICDAKDNNCDSKTDDADPLVTGQNLYYEDKDKDGYGNASVTTKTCSAVTPTGYTKVGGDCNDNDAAISPGAQEVCDGKDNDCDSLPDSFDPSVAGNNYYPDVDKDSYGDKASAATKGCDDFPPAGKVKDNTDCNDADNKVYPGASEICDSKDNDCDNQTDDSDSSVTGQNTYYKDNDTDGYGRTSSGTTLTCSSTAPAGFSRFSTDCNDADKNINPGALEVCDSVDNDCDSKTDDADDSVSQATQNKYYSDSDKDGHGSTSGSPVYSCSATPPTGSVTSNDDCDDSAKTVYTGASEGQKTDPAHYNCLLADGIDNDCDNVADEGTCSSDDDGDKKTEFDNDCNDADASIYTGAAEVCDNTDQDCDGNPTNGYDADGDGFLSAARCTGTPLGTDCNDNDRSIYPGASELCDGKDNDCDKYKDEDFDLDGDTFFSSEKCTDPSNPGTDCNDGDAAINPTATEKCDGVDQDCDGDKDNGFDQDADGSLSIALCAGFPGADDCDDSAAITYPGAPEKCDGVDNNCNGQTADEQNDSDGDKFSPCNPADPTRQDCDDTEKLTYPGAAEQCDGKDNDCDELVPETGAASELDTDEDGFRVCSGDCNDAVSAINPDASELCNEIDDNCDDDIDEGVQEIFYADTDGDGFGDLSLEQLACSAPNGFVDDASDCDDADQKTNPDANEVCDGRDNNCDEVQDTGELAFDKDQDSFLDQTQCSALSETTPLDCDDTAAAINPGVEELPGDGIDNDCDGSLAPAVEDGGEIFFEDSTLGCSCTSIDARPQSGGAPLAWSLTALAIGLTWRRRQSNRRS